MTRPAANLGGGGGGGGSQTVPPKAGPTPVVGLRGCTNPAHPDYYKRSDAESTHNHDLEDIYRSWDELIPDADVEYFTFYVNELVKENPQTAGQLEKVLNRLRKHFRRDRLPRKSQILHQYNVMTQRGEVPGDLTLGRLLIKKAQKSQSGVLVVTVLTSPTPTFGEGSQRKVQRFSCEWNCYYCPNEPGQPRSYLHDEPSVLRANRNDFDPVRQFVDRCATLAMNGHPVDKIELLVLGGTWTSYPQEYQEEFCRDLFFAANTFYERRNKRPRRSLDEEKLLNETARVKIIGITLETRPDCINGPELRRLRRYGCTRVQLGMQHTSDAVLKKINRGCDHAALVRAVRLLKDSCYKLDVHIMPNLPGASPDLDLQMFDQILLDPDLQVDQWKIYPCEITPWTVIKKWYDSGEYVPYSEDELFEVLMNVMPRVHPWIRVNRVIRDIPSQYILGGMDRPNLRQDLDERLRARNIQCHDIRAREVRGKSDLAEQAELVVRTYKSSRGVEHFISFETPDRRTIFGFARLRLTPCGRGSTALGEDGFPELDNAGLVRELHVYGQLVPTMQPVSGRSQHVGFGSQLMNKAEELTARAGRRRVAVIAGVGVRNFYRKIGYHLEERRGAQGEFMMKTLPPLFVLRHHSLTTAAVAMVLIVLLAVATVRLLPLVRVIGLSNLGM